MTPQEKALKTARHIYGPTAFTEDTISYRRIGYYRGTKIVMAIGDTWAEAFTNLMVK